MTEPIWVFKETTHPPLMNDAWSFMTRYHPGGLLSHCAPRRSISLEWEVLAHRPTLCGAWTLDLELNVEVVAATARHGGLAARAVVDCAVGEDRFQGEASLVLFQWNPGTFDRASAKLGQCSVSARNLAEICSVTELRVDMPTIRQVRAWKPRLSGLGGWVVMPIEFDFQMSSKADH